MSTAILVIWTVVAIHGSGTGNTYDVRYDWRSLGEFKDVGSCVDAAKLLAIKEERFRCLPTKQEGNRG
jgi:hypothetical protein